MDIGICVTDSLCCTPETNMVNQLYSNKNFLKIIITTKSQSTSYVPGAIINPLHIPTHLISTTTYRYYYYCLSSYITLWDRYYHITIISISWMRKWGTGRPSPCPRSHSWLVVALGHKSNHSGSRVHAYNHSTVLPLQLFL